MTLSGQESGTTQRGYEVHLDNGFYYSSCSQTSNPRCFTCQSGRSARLSCFHPSNVDL